MEASRRPAAGGQAGNKINLSTLNPQQLQMLKEQFENELQSFSQSAITLQKAAGEFHSGARAIEELGQRKQGDALLLPLTSSMYVAGSLEATDKVLIDVGTGYYIEKSTDGGVDYCKRKIVLLKENLEALQQMIREKQAALRQIELVLQQKVQTAGGSSAD